MLNQRRCLPSALSQLPPLLSGGELLYRNLLLLSLPPCPSYTLSPTLFSVPQPKALLHILHHLLSPLPTLPLPYPRYLLALLTALPPALSLCYPPHSPTDARDFLALAFPLLVALEEWTERAILPPGCVRKSVLQAGGGDRVVALLLHLSTWRLRERLEEEGGWEVEGVGPVGAGAVKVWEERVGLDETVRTLQLQLIATGGQTITALQQMDAEQRQWTETATSLQAEWRRVQEQLKVAQAEERRLRSTIDPLILSDAGAHQRAQMADALAAEYSRRSTFLQRTRQQRAALVELVNGAWTPTTVTRAQLPSALRESGGGGGGSYDGENSHGRVELVEVMRRWKGELKQVKRELEAASTESRREAAVRAEGEVEHCMTHQQRLHGELGGLQQQLTEALTDLSHGRPRPAKASAKESQSVPSPLASFFTLYSARSRQAERRAEARPITNVPALAELSLHGESGEEAVEAAEEVAGVSVGSLATPLKSGVDQHDAGTLGTPPAYMAGGGLLDDDPVDTDD